MAFLSNFFAQNMSGLKLGGEPEVLRLVATAGTAMSECLEKDGLIVTAGNGGSMADAVHLAEELSGRYRNTRRALRAVSLSDGAFLTCVANDFGFEHSFSRGFEALLRPGDCAVLFSTSGRSPNVVEAARVSRERGAIVVAMTGRKDGPLEEFADYLLAPSQDVPTEIAQLIHTMWTHMLIETIEKRLGF